MKKHAVILTCMALGLTLSFAQNDPNASQPDASAGAAISTDSSTQESSSTTGTEQSGQSAESRTVVEPSGAGIEQEAGTITLQGTVQTAEEKKAIEDHLKTMPGVKKVENKLTVIGDISEPSGASTEEDASKTEAEKSESPDASGTQSSPDQSSQNP